MIGSNSEDYRETERNIDNDFTLIATKDKTKAFPNAIIKRKRLYKKEIANPVQCRFRNFYTRRIRTIQLRQYRI